MSFAVFTDSCSNLPGSLLQHFGIRVLPCSYTVDGKQIIYGGDIEAFDAHTYYELLRQGKRVTTSLLNTQVFLDHFRRDGPAAIGRLRTGCRGIRLKILIFVQNGFQGVFFCIQIKRNVLWRAIKLVHMVNSF